MNIRNLLLEWVRGLDPTINTLENFVESTLITTLLQIEGCLNLPKIIEREFPLIKLDIKENLDEACCLLLAYVCLKTDNVDFYSEIKRSMCLLPELVQIGIRDFLTNLQNFNLPQLTISQLSEIVNNFNKYTDENSLSNQGTPKASKIPSCPSTPLNRWASPGVQGSPLEAFFQKNSAKKPKCRFCQDHVKEIRHLQSQLFEKEEEIVHVLKQYEEAKHKVLTLDASLKGSKSKITDLDNDLKHALEETERKENDLLKASKIIQENKHFLKEQQEQIAALEAELENSRKVFQKTEVEKLFESNKLNVLSGELKELQDERDAIVIQRRENLNEILELKKVIMDLKDELEVKKQSNLDLEKLKRSQSEFIEKNLQVIEENQALKERLDHLKVLSEDLQRHIDNSKCQLEELMVENTRLKDELQLSHEHTEKFECEKNIMAKRVVQVEEERVCLQKQFETMTNQLSLCKNELNESLVEIDKWKKENQMLNKMKTKLLEDNEQFKFKLDNALADFHKKITNLEVDSEKLKQEISQLIACKNKLTFENNELKEYLKIANEKISNLTLQIDVCVENERELRKKKEAELMTENMSLKKICEDTSTDVSNFKARINNLEKEHLSLTDQNTVLMDKIQELSDLVNEKVKEVERLKFENDNILRNHEKLLNNETISNKEIIRLEEQLRSCSNNITALEKNNQQMIEENDILKKNFEEILKIKRDLEQQITEANNTADNLAVANEKLTENVDKFIEDMNFLNNKINELTLSNQIANEQGADYERQIATLKLENKVLTQNVAELGEKNESLKEEATLMTLQLKDKLAHCQTQYELTKQENCDLIACKSRFVELIRQLEKKYKTTSGKLSFVEDEEDQSMKQNNVLLHNQNSNDTKGKFCEENTLFREEIPNIYEFLECLSEQISNMNTTLGKLKLQNCKLVEYKKNLLEENSVLKKKVDCIDKSFKECQLKLEKFEMENTALVEVKQKTVEEKIVLNETIEKLLHQSQALNQLVLKSNSKIEKLELEKQGMAQEQTTLMNQVSTLTSQHSEVLKTLSEQEGRVKVAEYNCKFWRDKYYEAKKTYCDIEKSCNKELEEKKNSLESCQKERSRLLKINEQLIEKTKALERKLDEERKKLNDEIVEMGKLFGLNLSANSGKSAVALLKEEYSIIHRRLISTAADVKQLKCSLNAAVDLLAKSGPMRNLPTIEEILSRSQQLSNTFTISINNLPTTVKEINSDLWMFFEDVIKRLKNIPMLKDPSLSQIMERLDPQKDNSKIEDSLAAKKIESEFFTYKLAHTLYLTNLFSKRFIGRDNPLTEKFFNSYYDLMSDLGKRFLNISNLNKKLLTLKILDENVAKGIVDEFDKEWQLLCVSYEKIAKLNDVMEKLVAYESDSEIAPDSLNDTLGLDESIVENPNNTEDPYLCETKYILSPKFLPCTKCKSYVDQLERNLHLITTSEQKLAQNYMQVFKCKTAIEDVKSKMKNCLSENRTFRDELKQCRNKATSYEELNKKLQKELLSSEDELKRAKEQIKMLREERELKIQNNNELRNLVWVLGEKYLEKDNKRERRNNFGEVAGCQKSTTGGCPASTVETDSSKNAPGSSFALPVPMPVEDEGEVFDNRCLSEILQNHLSPGSKFRKKWPLNDKKLSNDVKDDPISRLAELQRRNSMLPLHLQSSYPAETQLLGPSVFQENQLRSGLQFSLQEETNEPGSQETTESSDPSMTRALLKSDKPRKKGQISYKRPGPPTPSKNGRHTIGGDVKSALTPRRVLKEQNGIGEKMRNTPSRLKSLFTSSRSSNKWESLGPTDENSAPTTPRRGLKIFQRKPFGVRDY